MAKLAIFDLIIDRRKAVEAQNGPNGHFVRWLKMSHFASKYAGKMTKFGHFDSWSLYGQLSAI